MADGLDVIIVDDDFSVCKVISTVIGKFYTWGEILSFNDADKAISYCLGREIGVGIFIIDVYLGRRSGFEFINVIAENFPSAHEDAIIITGNASDEVVNMCIASNVTHLLEKPIRSYALQLAVRSIVMKYMRFAKRLLQDSAFAEDVSKL